MFDPTQSKDLGKEMAIEKTNQWILGYDVGAAFGFSAYRIPSRGMAPLTCRWGRYLCRALAEVLVAVRLQQDRRNLVE